MEFLGEPKRGNPLGKPKGAVSHPELYILFNMGYTIKQIMALNFKPAMVYSYHRKYIIAKEKIAKLIAY